MVEPNGCWDYNRDTAREQPKKLMKGAVNHEKHEIYCQNTGNGRKDRAKAGCSCPAQSGKQFGKISAKFGRKRL